MVDLCPVESLVQFMYRKPTAAKRLYFDTIPKSVDDYLAHLKLFPTQELKDQLNNPAWHIHNGVPPEEKAHISFGVLLNLVSVCHSDDPTVLWHYITRNAPDADPESNPLLDKLVSHAIAYYRDFVLPSKTFRTPSIAERKALEELKEGLEKIEQGSSEKDLQSVVYAVGTAHAETFPDLRDWFKALYQILLGQDQGPRMGSFIALYGVEETVSLITRVLAGEDLAQV